MGGNRGPDTPPGQKQWERQGGESWPAFEAFQKYLHLGGQRSIAAVARDVKKSRQLIEGWCRANDWVNRVDAFTRWLLEEGRARHGDEAAEAVRRHLQEVKALQSVKGAFINEFARRTKSDPAWMQALEPWQFSRLMIALSRSLAVDVGVERQALGIRDAGPDEGAGAVLKDQGTSLVLNAWQPSPEEVKRLRDHQPAP